MSACLSYIVFKIVVFVTACKASCAFRPIPLGPYVIVTLLPWLNTQYVVFIHLPLSFVYNIQVIFFIEFVAIALEQLAYCSWKQIIFFLLNTLGRWKQATGQIMFKHLKPFINFTIR